MGHGEAAGSRCEPPARRSSAGRSARTGRRHGRAAVDDMFTVDLAAAAEAATARRGSLGRAVLVAVLHRQPADAGSAATELARLLGIPVTSPLTEPAAARLGAATTPGMLARRAGRRHRVGHHRRDRAPTAARRLSPGPGNCSRSRSRKPSAFRARRPTGSSAARASGSTAASGTRPRTAAGASLTSPRPRPAAGMLAVPGPGGLLPFAAARPTAPPSEWRAIRLRLKQAVLAGSLQRASDRSGRARPRSRRVARPNSCWSAARPPTTSSSASSPAPCPTRSRSAAATSAPPATARPWATATR